MFEETTTPLALEPPYIAFESPLDTTILVDCAPAWLPPPYIF